jgi:hypothetical protein
MDVSPTFYNDRGECPYHVESKFDNRRAVPRTGDYIIINAILPAQRIGHDCLHFVLLDHYDDPHSIHMDIPDMQEAEEQGMSLLKARIFMSFTVLLI